MQESVLTLLKKNKVDALYGKKKHFNAADRVERYHHFLGVPVVILNVIAASVLFFVLTDGVDGWVKYAALAVPLVTAVLSGLQTFFNFQRKAEAHRKIGNQYLSVMKECDRIVVYAGDNMLTEGEIVEKLEAIAKRVEEINSDAQSFPTSDSDYKLAKKGIEAGEEGYTEEEFNI